MTDKELEGARLSQATIRIRGIRIARVLNDWITEKHDALAHADKRMLREAIRVLAQISRRDANNDLP